MNSKQRSRRLAFSSKAKILELLSKTISSARVLPLYSFKAEQFKKNSRKLISSIQNAFNDDYVIVRSSQANEDADGCSKAGHYKSVLNVPLRNKEKLFDAINDVILSYKDENMQNSEVFVQPILQNIKLAGVAFTSDINTLAPYYIINYDESGKPDIITSGVNGSYKTYIHFRESPLKCKNKNLSSLITTLKELESIFNTKFLDVEFAFNLKNELYIFQVRPLSKGNKEDLSDIQLGNHLNQLYQKINKLSVVHPNLLGDQAIYGVMPDWNPAEMIGLKPKQLAISLYKEIITDNIWAYQRDNYGYRNLRSHPLMVSFLGMPYIDVRVDFNSFIPKDLDDNVAEKLINYYLKKLKAVPDLHDKVEFEIVHSCYYFNLPEKLEDLKQHGFSSKEIKAIKTSLLKLTNNIINYKSGLYKNDLRKIEILKEKYIQIINSKLSNVDKLYWLIEDCKRYGTLPFAGIARAAFIATQLLKSLVELGVLTKEEHGMFLNSLNTIAKTLKEDLMKFNQGKMTKATFLDLYGHLRPGTYDILSLRYDENFDHYFLTSKETDINEINEFKLTRTQLLKINNLLLENGLNIKVTEFLEFVKEAIEGREYAKYVFTKSLSQVLKIVEEIGYKNGFNREELAFLDIKTILNLYFSLDYRNIKDILNVDILKNKESHLYTKAINLPSLISNPEDIFSFFLNDEEPNFITLGQVRSNIFKEEDFELDNPEGKIVLIKSADPGYDFLFSRKIKGLITQFGGANSHMAVRCAELGIPAVIGSGAQKYNSWVKANILEIDCLNKQVRIVS